MSKKYYYSVMVPLCFDDNGELLWCFICGLPFKDDPIDGRQKYNTLAEAKETAKPWKMYRIYRIDENDNRVLVKEKI